MDQMRLTFFMVSLSFWMARAMFVTGPKAMISISPGFAFIVSRMKSMAFFSWGFPLGCIMSASPIPSFP